MTRIEEIEAREKAATKGLWTDSRRKGNKRVAVVEGDGLVGSFGVWTTLDWPKRRPPLDANFIAHAREDIPYLLAQLAEAKAENECLTTGFESLRQSLTVMQPEYERLKAAAAPLLMLESLIGRWHLERFGSPHDSYPAAALELLAALDALKGVE